MLVAMSIKNPEARRQYERDRRSRARARNRGVVRPSLAMAGDKRRCETEECSTVLSIYNSDSHCAIHLPAVLRKSPDVSAWLN